MLEFTSAHHSDLADLLFDSSSQAQTHSNIKFAAWPTSWRPRGSERLSLRGPKVNSRALNNSTINIALCIVVIIFINKHGL